MYSFSKYGPAKYSTTEMHCISGKFEIVNPAILIVHGPQNKTDLFAALRLLADMLETDQLKAKVI